MSFALIGAYDIDPDLLAAARLGLAAIAFAPLLWRCEARTATRTSPSKRLRLTGIGALQYGVMYVLVLRSYRHLAGHEVALLTITTPIFVVMVEAALSRRAALRAPSAVRTWRAARTWTAAAVAVAAALVLRGDAVRGTDTSGDFWVGFALVQGANLAWAAGQVLYRRVEPESNRAGARFGWLFLGGFAVAVTWALPHVNASALDLSTDELGVIAYLGLVPSGLAFYLWNRGATRVDVGRLAVMNNLKIPLAVAVALLPPFSEPADLPRLAVSFALLLVALGLTRRRSQSAG